MTTNKATASTTAKTQNRKALADYKDTAVTPLMQEYAEWITANTGVKVDARSVFLGSALRTRFQAERRAAKATAKPARKRAPKAAPQATPKAKAKGSTIATKAGVVIAEQRHIDAAKEA